MGRGEETVELDVGDDIAGGRVLYFEAVGVDELLEMGHSLRNGASYL